MAPPGVPSGGYGLRKRRKTNDASGPPPMERLEAAVRKASRILVFSGSGLSANCGMSTFSTRGGLYERASRRYRLSDGKSLFTYSWYERNRRDALAFFCDVHDEAVRAVPGPGHRALARIDALVRKGEEGHWEGAGEGAGKEPGEEPGEEHVLLRHYTMNVDGLSQAASIPPLPTWCPEERPWARLVELHGSVRELVCPECGERVLPTGAMLEELRRKRDLPCPVCLEEWNKDGGKQEGVAAGGAKVCEGAQTNPFDGPFLSPSAPPAFVSVPPAAPTPVPVSVPSPPSSRPATPSCLSSPPLLRFRMMLYDDRESEAITPDEVVERMEDDARAADLVLWVGISFQQSASTAYFRNVRRATNEGAKGSRGGGRAEGGGGRGGSGAGGAGGAGAIPRASSPHLVPRAASPSAPPLHVVINPDPEAVWNLLTACHNATDVDLLHVPASGDEALPRVLRALHEGGRWTERSQAGGEPEKAQGKTTRFGGREEQNTAGGAKTPVIAAPAAAAAPASAATAAAVTTDAAALAAAAIDTDTAAPGDDDGRCGARKEPKVWGDDPEEVGLEENCTDAKNEHGAEGRGSWEDDPSATLSAPDKLAILSVTEQRASFKPSSREPTSSDEHASAECPTPLESPALSEPLRPLAVPASPAASGRETSVGGSLSVALPPPAAEPPSVAPPPPAAEPPSVAPPPPAAEPPSVAPPPPAAEPPSVAPPPPAAEPPSVAPPPPAAEPPSVAGPLSIAGPLSSAEPASVSKLPSVAKLPSIAELPPASPPPASPAPTPAALPYPPLPPLPPVPAPVASRLSPTFLYLRPEIFPSLSGAELPIPPPHLAVAGADPNRQGEAESGDATARTKGGMPGSVSIGKETQVPALSAIASLPVSGGVIDLTFSGASRGDAPRAPLSALPSASLSPAPLPSGGTAIVLSSGGSFVSASSDPASDDAQRGTLPPGAGAASGPASNASSGPPSVVIVSCRLASVTPPVSGVAAAALAGDDPPPAGGRNDGSGIETE